MLLSDSGNPNFRRLTADEFRRAMTRIAELDTVLLVYAESHDIIDASPPPSGRFYSSFLASRPAIARDGADVICLGRAGMAGVTAAISSKLGVPAIDGVAAAVGLAQTLVGLGLTTSKAGAYAPGPDNARSHWPLSTALRPGS